MMNDTRKNTYFLLCGLEYNMYNIHAFVLVASLIFYGMLRLYKNDIERKDSKSKLVYVLFVPVVMYTCHYLFPSSNGASSPDTGSVVSNDVMTSPYPDSVSIGSISS